MHTCICICNIKVHINVHTCITCRYWILIMNKFDLHVYHCDTYRSSLGCWYYACSLWQDGTAAPPRGFLGGALRPKLHWAWVSLGWWASHCKRACRTWCCLVWQTRYKKSIAPDAARQRFHQWMYLKKSWCFKQKEKHWLIVSYFLQYLVSDSNK